MWLEYAAMEGWGEPWAYFLKKSEWKNKRVRLTTTWKCGTGNPDEELLNDGWIRITIQDLGDSARAAGPVLTLWSVQQIPFVSSWPYDDGRPGGESEEGANWLCSAILGDYGFLGSIERFSVEGAPEPVPPEPFVQEGSVGLTWVEFTPRDEGTTTRRKKPFSRENW